MEDKEKVEMKAAVEPVDKKALKKPTPAVIPKEECERLAKRMSNRVLVGQLKSPNNPKELKDAMKAELERRK